VIIVTGGAGFIGSNIVADLNELGITDIVIVDWLGSDAKWRNLAKRRFSDIVFPEELDGFLESTRNVDAVIHMGAISSTTASDADEIIRSNFRLSSRLWSWCTRIRCPFIYASSAATYGDGANGFSDDLRPSQMDALRPLNLYGWSKGGGLKFRLVMNASLRSRFRYACYAKRFIQQHQQLAPTQVDLVERVGGNPAMGKQPQRLVLLSRKWFVRAPRSE
jgi:UDP-glucose 4-epimerase